MKLSTRGRYAVMAMVDLAETGSDKPVTLADISARQDISQSYLEQLFGKLRKAGLVESSRGAGGGYALAREPAGIRISDVILAVDEPIKTTRCGEDGQGCMGAAGRCLTHDLWDELSRHIHVFLASITLDDVVERRVLGRSFGPEALFDERRA